MYILALLKKLKHSTVIVVHNFKDAEEVDDLQSMIDSDIKGLQEFADGIRVKFSQLLTYSKTLTWRLMELVYLSRLHYINPFFYA